MIRLAKHLLQSTIDAINELDYNSKAYHTVINTRGCIPQWRRDYAGFDEILALVDTLEDEIDDYLIRYKQANN